MDLLSSVGVLLLTMDPLGNVPNFVAVLHQVPAERRTSVVIRELFIALGLMLAFLFVGARLMSLLGIRSEAITIAGGILLFLIAIEMIFPSQNRRTAEVTGGDPFIVPLATPLVAGPSTLATLILLSNKDGGALGALPALLVAWVVTFICLVSAPRLARILRERGARAVERLMGMLLVMLAVQMFLNGLREYLGS
ncbi:MAG TPA: MarC family protein [Chthoniobacteraceae bacterium]|jgi:multiple antibiotic resistance protein|nr:MarC family protein [Chthoniobacteraceae bacterium]